jgi:arginine/lysine/ornithine decarboxylase
MCFIHSPDIAAVILTSPTYDGVVSDITAISEIVHAHGIPLIVDEAHGAHLGFHPYFPQTAVRLGADVVIQSMHKTLPSFTQTALLHVKGNRIDQAQIARFLDIYETSSPSYVLMAGMDRCVRMLEEDGTSYFNEYTKQLKDFYQKADRLHNLKVLQPGELSKEECYAFDPSKIVINGSKCGLNGKQLYEIFLDKYHLQMELCSGDYVLAMTSFLNTAKDYDRLFHALMEIDDEYLEEENTVNASGFISRVYVPNEKEMEIAEAVDSTHCEIPLTKAAGKLSGDYIYLYPPGIPLLVPGEVITEKMIENIEECFRLELDVKGIHKLRINIVN